MYVTRLKLEWLLQTLHYSTECQLHLISEKELLLAFKEKQDNGFLSAWTADSDMCSWSDVYCSQNGHVTGL